jgi:cell wall-associated NlpC family hydrolase
MRRSTAHRALARRLTTASVAATLVSAGFAAPARADASEDGLTVSGSMSAEEQADRLDRSVVVSRETKVGGLEEPSAAVEPAPDPLTRYTLRKVNVRSGPGADRDVERTLPKGRKVTVVNQRGKWAQLKGGGFVRADRLAAALAVDPYAAVTGRELAVREEADAEAESKDELAPGTEITVVGRSGRWAQLEGGGFVRAGRLIAVEQTTPARRTVTQDLNVRTGPGVDFDRVGWKAEGQAVTVQARAEQWVQLDDGDWVHGHYLTEPAPPPAEETVEVSVEELPEAAEAILAELGSTATDELQAVDAKELSDDFGTRVVELAASFSGVPYVWGGSSPRSGFDCSGLVSYVYGQLGVHLPHYSGSIREVGTVIDRSEARPGDVIWTPGHVGIYAGGNLQVDAARGSWWDTGVREIWQSNPVFLRIAR